MTFNQLDFATYCIGSFLIWNSASHGLESMAGGIVWTG